MALTKERLEEILTHYVCRGIEIADLLGFSKESYLAVLRKTWENKPEFNWDRSGLE